MSEFGDFTPSPPPDLPDAPLKSVAAQAAMDLVARGVFLGPLSYACDQHPNLPSHIRAANDYSLLLRDKELKAGEVDKNTAADWINQDLKRALGDISQRSAN